MRGGGGGGGEEEEEERRGPVLRLPPPGLLDAAEGSEIENDSVRELTMEVERLGPGSGFSNVKMESLQVSAVELASERDSDGNGVDSVGSVAELEEQEVWKSRCASVGIENGSGEESVDIGEENGVRIGSDVSSVDGVFDSGRVGNGCESAAEFSSATVHPESGKEVDAYCSLNCESILTEEISEKLFVSESDGNKEENLNSSVDGERGNVVVQKQQEIKVNIGEPTQETIVLPLEIFKGDVCPSSQVGGEIGSSLEGLTSEAVSRSSTGLTSQQSPNNSTFIENCLEPLLVTDYEGCEVGAVTGFVSSFDRVNNSCGETENGGRSDMIDSRCANPNHAASLSSSLKDGKPEQLTRTRNNGRKFRKTVESTKPLLHATVKHLDKFKRKRSFPRRPARLSDWGPVDNLLKVFKQNGELESYASDTIPVKKVRPMFGVDREKHMKCQKDVTQVSSAVQDAPSHQPVFPVMDGSRSSDCLPTSVSQLDGGIFSAVRSEEKLAYDRCAYGLRSHQELGQIGDKDLDSTLMQEISVDDIVGKCHGVSPQVGPEMLVETVNCRSSLEAGTSPDSDVCHPMLGGVLMASEDASTNHVSRTIDVGIVPSKDTTSTNQVIGMDRSVTVLESVSGTGFPTGDIISSGASVTPFTVPPLESELHTSPRGTDSCKDSTQLCLISEHFMIDEKPHDLEKLNKSWKPSMQRKSEQKKNVSDGDSQLCSNFSRSTEKGSKCKSFPVESSAFGIAALEHSEESMKVQTLERWESSGMETSNWNSEERPMNNGLKGRKPPRSIKPRGSNDGSRRTNAHGKKQGNARKSDKKFSTKEKSGTFDASVDASDGMSLSSGTTKLAMAISNQFNSNTDAGSKVVSEEVSGSVTVAVGEQLPPKECNNSEEQSLSPKLAWVSCDDCQKWRCISVELANAIDDTNCKWICKDNTVKAFADCSIPQEKTNAEINAELGISDEDESFSANPSSKGPEPPKLAAPLQASWTVIKSNVFLHRNRRSQTIDEIMVCHCKPPRDGSLGCGDQCLNRMLNIECVKGTCPCGDLCSNQQFQKRKYVNLKKFHYGKKGYGLQLQEDASRGKFLIEYVGEVLDLASYEARQRYYASQGQKHFYFMTLNGGEVIDACVKGNLGRFINHSCDPNCRTEKWMVNGEVCIGLFAMRDIKKGEEVTFDYNYVRVVGAAAKKCVCGSSECRGYLGGDPLNSEVIVHGDSDDEALEPMINHEVGERDLNLEKTSLDGGDVEVVKKEQICIQRKDTLVQYSPAITEPNICDQIKNAVCCPSADIYPLDNPLPMLDSIPSEDTSPRSLSDIQPLRDPKDTLSSRQIEDTVCKPISDIQSSQLPLQTSNRVSTVLLDPSAISRKSVSSLIEGKSNTEKPLSHANYSRSRGKNKKGRSSVKHVVPPSSKKLTVGTGNVHCDGVEEKLNELLDMDGGISKQTDATRGYLKLLFVTAAEGDVRGCAFQSTRDLSLILDVILKTKSRKVLVDIINKNGLQMLHNILKQNRSNFNRIPIIRKLLKVLEFLALKGILSPEQINRDPPCNGMESFKESILSLTRHSDVQVHQIARNFRDKWIPRTFKRVEQSDRDGSRLDPQHSCRSWFQSSSKLKCWTEQGARETASIVTSTTTHLPASSVERDIPGQPSSHGQRVPNSAHVTDKISACGTRIRKRKSRWGPPLDTSSLHPQSLCSVENIVVDGVKCRKLSSVQQEKTSQHEGSNQTSSSSWDEIASVSNLMHKNANVESPPGFGSLRQNASVEAPPGFGYPQENGSGETPPQFGCLQHNDSGETPPGFGYPQKNASVEAPPGFGFPQQNPTVEAPPGFEIPQQNSSVEAPPGFEFPQQNASVETPPGFGFTQQNASDETPPGFVSPQQNASVEAPPGFGYLEKNANFEASPGFESRQEEHSSQMSSEIPVSPGEVFMGQLQGRYLSHLTVSFGIPVSLMQLGTPETGGSHCNPSWSVAPSMPFHPFPPLPSYPHPTAERGQTHVSSGTEKTTSSTSEGLGRISESFYRKSQIHGRLSWTSNGPARRFPGQQRRNDGRFPRCLPYPNQRIGQGTKGSMRDGTSNLGLEE